MALKRTDFDYVASLAHAGAAIVLEPGKEYLVESRLEPVARAEGFGSLEEMLGALRQHARNGPLHGKIIDALTTNETFFFRDFHPFEALRKTLLPELLRLRAEVKRLTLWSAACSTGQEAYSLAMLMREHFPQLKDWNLRIIGTDLSPKVLTQAREGKYTQLEVNRGLPAVYLMKYFERRDNAWFIKSELKSGIEFRSMNLAQPWPILPAFDLIFLRNVMIYFDVATKRSILKRIRSCLLPHGSLFLGTAETTINLDPGWKPVTYGNAVAYQMHPETAPALSGRTT